MAKIELFIWEFLKRSVFTLGCVQHLFRRYYEQYFLKGRKVSAGDYLRRERFL